MIEELQAGRLTLRDIPPIRVVRVNRITPPAANL